MSLVTKVSKSEFDSLMGWATSNSEYANAYYCEIDEEWTTLDEDGYPYCYCN
jgi:hypothetical protein